MLATRSCTALRPVRTTLRAQAQNFRSRNPRNIRFESSNAPNLAPKGQAPAVVGGLAGGLGVFFVGYLWYHFSGAKTFISSANEVQSYFKSTFKKTQDAAPEPNEAIEWLRNTITSYTKMIPGASTYVDAAFNDIDKVREKHGDEVDKIVRDAYDQLKDATKKGVSLEAVSSAWDILQNAMKRIGSLASDAAGDILENHPQLKEKVGGNIEQLKQMGDEYGPEAKKAVDETWKEVSNILKGGFSMDTINKVQKLLQEKSLEMKKYGDQAWQTGLEKAKPFLDKQPELKETIQKNKDALLHGDLGQLWKKLQETAKSGDNDDIKKFIKQQTEKAQEQVQSKSSGGIEQFLQMVPGGGNIGPQLQQLQELSQKHGKEAEDIVKSAMEEIKGVLQKKMEEGQKLKKKAESDVKT